MDDINQNENEHTNIDNDIVNNSNVTSINPDAPSFVKEMYAKNHVPLDVSVDYEVQNPYEYVYPGGYLSSSSLEGIKQTSGFFEAASAQAYKMNATLQGLNALDDFGETLDPHFYDKPDNWTPKTDIANFINVKDQYMPALLNARSPKHQQLILSKIYEEQKRDDDIANGSWLAWLLGGAVGMITDPMSYIPISSWVKYGKISSSFVKSAMKAAPGAAAYGLLSSASEQMDKVNGNMHDFIIDSFTRTAFGTILFGGLGAGASLTERIGLWEIRNLAKAEVDGISFKFKMKENGEINGYEVVDKSNGALSAQKVSFYEDMAKSAFLRSGVFKLPYLGEGIIKLAGMPVFGSPLINLINSTSNVVRSTIDRVADHTFLTKGIEEGKAAPDKFASLMNQEHAKLMSLSTQYDALFYEYNGIKIKSRAGASAVENALYIRNKGMEVLGQTIDKDAYRSREEFDAAVTQVLHSNVQSENSAVNEAAKIDREQTDRIYAAYRKAYNLPDDWIPPKTSKGFASRVYDTAYMNNHLDDWIRIISNWLEKADNIIEARMQPIKDIETLIQKNMADQEILLMRPNVTDKEKKLISDELKALKANKKALEENLQDELRSNEDLILHVEDWNALSAKEADELTKLTKRRDIAQKEIDEQKKLISGIKAEAAKRSSAALKNATVKAAKGNKRKAAIGEEVLAQEEAKLHILEKELDEEEQKLQELAHGGKINPRFYTKTPDSFIYVFKDPKNRLRFRDTYNNHSERKTDAEAYYDSIMNQTPEDVINQVMGKLTGNGRENPLKKRTLLLPDQVLYDGKFLSNNVMARTFNYSTYLARRTHLKNVFNDVTIDGGFDPVIAELQREFKDLHKFLNARKTELEEKIKDPKLSDKDKKDIEKNLKAIDKRIVKERNNFDKNKDVLNHLYDKMMGIQKTSRRAQQIKSSVMSITAWVNLPFVPLTMINDLSAIGLQHGIIPFIRDGLYPLVQSLGGILKTKDSEAFRLTAPSIHLALQDVQMGYAHRNWSMHTNPYVNLGKFVDTLGKIAHLSSNFTGTNYIDNMLQRITGSVSQSELMRILHSYKAGNINKRDLNYLLKYGIQPEIWADRMLNAFKKNGGGKTKTGGYQSHFWAWEDKEASNRFSQAVFRSIKDTNIQAGILDAPLFTDDNGPIGIMGSFLRGFSGWAFASVNRYVIPSLQGSGTLLGDAEKMIGVMGMLATGYLVDPMRRVARGEELFPDNLTDKQIIWATINNSGYFSFFANILANANMIAGGNLLGDLKSDKYKNRTRAGLLGPAWGTVNRMADIISALASNEMNEADAKKMARMIPFANASWTWLMSEHLIESLGLPKTRREAHALNE